MPCKICDAETGDKGQRYECRMKICKDTEVIMGWAETLGGVQTMRESVKLHPVWSDFRVIDRKENSNGKEEKSSQKENS